MLSPQRPDLPPSASQNMTHYLSSQPGDEALPKSFLQLLASLLYFQHLQQSLFADFQTPFFPRWIKVTGSDKPEVSPGFGRTLSSFCSSSSSSSISSSSLPMPNPFCQPLLKINFYISDTKVVLLEK